MGKKHVVQEVVVLVAVDEKVRWEVELESDGKWVGYQHGLHIGLSRG